MMRIILDPYLTKDGVICNIFSKDKFTSIKADNMKELGYKILERVRILSKHEYKQIVKISIEASGIAVALANYLTSYGIKVKILKSENIDCWLPIN